MITAYHARYFANSITCRYANNENDKRLSQSLFDAKVELNPHQIDAALFALKNPIQQGVLLADEVGLGKTIEAGLVLCQMWAEQKRHLLIVCPAILRKQWANELSEKFGLPTLIVDTKIVKSAGTTLYDFCQEQLGKKIIIISHQFASKEKTTFKSFAWDWVVIDEAHKMRSAYKSDNKMGQAMREAFSGRKKIIAYGDSFTKFINGIIRLIHFIR